MTLFAFVESHIYRQADRRTGRLADGQADAWADRRTDRINYQKPACENGKPRIVYTLCFYCSIIEVNVRCRMINNALFSRFEVDRRQFQTTCIPDFKIMQFVMLFVL